MLELIGAMLKVGLLFNTEILSGPENKEQSQVREPEDIMPHCMCGRQPWKSVVERGRIEHGPTEKV
jgi:hypothetical protein